MSHITKLVRMILFWICTFYLGSTYSTYCDDSILESPSTIAGKPATDTKHPAELKDMKYTVMSSNSNLYSDVELPAFGIIAKESVVASDELFALIWDKYPVSPGHLLIIARRPAPRFKELTTDEKERLLYWIDWSVGYLSEFLSPPPDAFNFGLNDGQAAGQTIKQIHFHVIPRYNGDVSDPRGGVRYVIPEKARYWDKK